jgi:hypothetical protein
MLGDLLLLATEQTQEELVPTPHNQCTITPENHTVALQGWRTDKRDLSLEVPQKELESLNARFVWIPELEEEDIVGIVAEHAARTGVKSIAIPAYWILKEGMTSGHRRTRKLKKMRR